MADGTGIEWTEATWNPVTGCSVVSPGCTNCYAMKLAGTRMKHHESRAGLTQPSKAGPVWTGAVRFNGQWLDQPLRWRRARRIFVAAHGDLFHENVPDEWIDRIFAVMALAPQHTFQVLTKRPERMREYLRGVYYRLRGRGADGTYFGMEQADMKMAVSRMQTEWPLRNVWLGVSVEDQQRADVRIPLLLDTPAAVRFVSAEPLLGLVEFWPCWLEKRTLCGRCPSDQEDTPIDCPSADPALDWIIVGGESGPGARPMHPDWARSVRDQCRSAGVAFFMKQMAKKAPIPEDLQIREWPG